LALELVKLMGIMTEFRCGLGVGAFDIMTCWIDSEMVLGLGVSYLAFGQGIS
jgi:hypothetical protein